MAKNPKVPECTGNYSCGPMVFAMCDDRACIAKKEPVMSDISTLGEALEEIDRLNEELESCKFGLARANEAYTKLMLEFKDSKGSVGAIEVLSKKMRELGIMSLKTRDVELVLGPEPLVQTLDQVPMDVATSSDPSKLPPRDSPIWWSTPHYSATPEKKEE